MTKDRRFLWTLNTGRRFDTSATGSFSISMQYLKQDVMEPSVGSSFVKKLEVKTFKPSPPLKNSQLKRHQKRKPGPKKPLNIDTGRQPSVGAAWPPSSRLTFVLELLCYQCPVNRKLNRQEGQVVRGERVRTSVISQATKHAFTLADPRDPDPSLERAWDTSSETTDGQRIRNVYQKNWLWGKKMKQKSKHIRGRVGGGVELVKEHGELARHTWKTLRPLGDVRRVTDRWSTRSKACSAHGPKTNFRLEKQGNKHENNVVVCSVNKDLKCVLVKVFNEISSWNVSVLPHKGVGRAK